MFSDREFDENLNAMLENAEKAIKEHEIPGSSLLTRRYAYMSASAQMIRAMIKEIRCLRLENKIFNTQKKNWDEKDFSNKWIIFSPINHDWNLFDPLVKAGYRFSEASEMIIDLFKKESAKRKLDDPGA